jgi:hypothetical protein
MIIITQRQQQRNQHLRFTSYPTYIRILSNLRSSKQMEMKTRNRCFGIRVQRERESKSEKVCTYFHKIEI